MPQVLLLSIETRIIQRRGELDVRVSNIPFPVLVGSAVTVIDPDICFAATVTILDQSVSKIPRCFDKWMTYQDSF